MYILSTKIEIQTNTHIPITPSPLVNTAAHPLHKAHLHKKKTKKTKWGYHIHYLLPQMKRIRLMYATVRGGTVCNWKSNIKHRMECRPANN